MVRAGADEGQAQGEIHRSIGLQHFDGDEPLIMVEGHHQVELTLGGAVKKTIGGKRPEKTRGRASAGRGWDGSFGDLPVPGFAWEYFPAFRDTAGAERRGHMLEGRGNFV